MSESKCDHRSVGIIITNANGEILLIERRKFPPGLAAPAGHVDEHGGSLEAAVTETEEETGLYVVASDLRLVIDQRRVENACRRGGKYHIWDVYMADRYSGKLTPSEDETKGAKWYSIAEIQAIAATMKQGNSVEPKLEPVWLEFFTNLKIIE